MNTVSPHVRYHPYVTTRPRRQEVSADEKSCERPTVAPDQDTIIDASMPAQVLFSVQKQDVDSVTPGSLGDGPSSSSQRIFSTQEDENGRHDQEQASSKRESPTEEHHPQVSSGQDENTVDNDVETTLPEQNKDDGGDTTQLQYYDIANAYRLLLGASVDRNPTGNNLSFTRHVEVFRRELEQLGCPCHLFHFADGPLEYFGSFLKNHLSREMSSLDKVSKNGVAGIMADAELMCRYAESFYQDIRRMRMKCDTVVQEYYCKSGRECAVAEELRLFEKAERVYNQYHQNQRQKYSLMKRLLLQSWMLVITESNAICEGHSSLPRTFEKVLTLTEIIQDPEDNGDDVDYHIRRMEIDLSMKTLTLEDIRNLHGNFHWSDFECRSDSCALKRYRDLLKDLVPVYESELNIMQMMIDVWSCEWEYME